MCCHLSLERHRRRCCSSLYAPTVAVFAPVTHEINQLKNSCRLNGNSSHQQLKSQRKRGEAVVYYNVLKEREHYAGLEDSEETESETVETGKKEVKGLFAAYYPVSRQQNSSKWGKKRRNTRSFSVGRALVNVPGLLEKSTLLSECTAGSVRRKELQKRKRQRDYSGFKR